MVLPAFGGWVYAGFAMRSASAPAAAPSHETLTDLITVAVTVGSMAFGFALKWLNDKRRNSGSVETSAADTLWAQTQAFTRMLLEEKQHVEGQRDRLIESQAGQVAPALEALDKSMAAVLAALQANTAALTEVQELLAHGRQRDVPHSVQPANPDAVHG